MPLGIDTTKEYWQTMKLADPDYYQYFLNKKLKEISDTNYKIIYERGSRIITSIQTDCPTFDCGYWEGTILFDPYWLYDCRYYGSCQRPTFWINYASEVNDTTVCPCMNIKTFYSQINEY